MDHYRYYPEILQLTVEKVNQIRKQITASRLSPFRVLQNRSYLFLLVADLLKASMIASASIFPINL